MGILSLGEQYLTLDPKPGQVLRMEVGMLPLVFSTSLFWFGSILCAILMMSVAWTSPDEEAEPFSPLVNFAFSTELPAIPSASSSAMSAPLASIHLIPGGQEGSIFHPNPPP